VRQSQCILFAFPCQCIACIKLCKYTFLLGSVGYKLIVQLCTTEDAALSDPSDHRTRGRKFAEEAERHFKDEKNRPSIPLLQGQFAMFLYEGNVDGGSSSIDYFMGTVKTYEALNVPESLGSRDPEISATRKRKEQEGLSWIMWGVYCAEWYVFHVYAEHPNQRPTGAHRKHSDSRSRWQSRSYRNSGAAVPSRCAKSTPLRTGGRPTRNCDILSDP
jgi:hypothetical protein